MFCSLPKTHDFVHHGYIKYVRSLADRVDQICLITGSNKFSLVTIGTYWNDFPGLYDETLSFTSILAQQVGRNFNSFQLRNSWKYQALFDNGELVHFTDYHISDARAWLMTRMKEDYRWREHLVKQDAQAIKALKLLISNPEFIPDISTISLFKDTLSPMLMFDRLWPNKDLEQFIQDYSL